MAVVIGFVGFGYNKNFQLAVITAGSIAYFVWGVIHHFLHGDLNWEIALEYAVFASLGFVIGVSVIFRM